MAAADADGLFPGSLPGRLAATSRSDNPSRSYHCAPSSVPHTPKSPLPGPRLRASSSATWGLRLLEPAEAVSLAWAPVTAESPPAPSCCRDTLG